MTNPAFGKTMEARDIKLGRTCKKGNQLVPEPNCYTTKWFSENLLAIEMEIINFKLNKPVYLGLPILEMSKILMYEIWYDYIKVCEKVRKFESFFYKINTCLQKTTTCIGLRVEQIFSVNI